MNGQPQMTMKNFHRRSRLTYLQEHSLGWPLQGNERYNIWVKRQRDI